MHSCCLNDRLDLIVLLPGVIRVYNIAFVSQWVSWFERLELLSSKPSDTLLLSNSVAAPLYVSCHARKGSPDFQAGSVAFRSDCADVQANLEPQCSHDYFPF